MLKKSTLLGMLTAALLALAAPAAQATGPLITNANGEAAKTITAKGFGATTHTSIGLLECTTTNFHINVTGNASTTARGHGTGTMEGTPAAKTHTGHCASSSGAVVEVTNVTISDLHLTKNGAGTTGTAAFFYTYDLRSATGAGLIAECTFGGILAVKRVGFSTISVEGEIKKTAGTAFCPTMGTFTGAFFVFDNLGGTVTIH